MMNGKILYEMLKPCLPSPHRDEVPQWEVLPEWNRLFWENAAFVVDNYADARAGLTSIGEPPSEPPK